MNDKSCARGPAATPRAPVARRTSPSPLVAAKQDSAPMEAEADPDADLDGEADADVDAANAFKLSIDKSILPGTSSALIREYASSAALSASNPSAAVTNSYAICECIPEEANFPPLKIYHHLLPAIWRMCLPQILPLFPMEKAL
ncbi:hypothetical protein HDU82_006421 [Entophlyctis luteolus]|nr:hypothetical protein HDU82_006421 [Entophlyctis luteolus]